MKNGVRRRKETSQGWSFLCQRKDGSSNWIALKDARLSHPVLVAEYAIANRIDDEPAFAWWVHDVLKKRDRIIGSEGEVQVLATNKHTNLASRSPTQSKKRYRLIKRMEIIYGWRPFAKR